MKKLILPLILITLIGLELFFMKDITTFTTKLLNNHPDVVVEPSNAYKKNYDFQYVQNVSNYTPYSYHDLINIIFTAINNGWNEFTFYCPTEYTNCVNDVTDISKNENLLTSLSNFVSPYNSFNYIQTLYNDSGEITLEISKVYTDQEISQINTVVKQTINNLITPQMDTYTKILTIHDYIVNNTKYDTEKNNTGTSQYESENAYGLFVNHLATCSGYADTMALFLDEFGVKNYKVTSKSHVWNAVYYENKWVHLDLTWDDPVSNTGKDYLYHKYFLIDTSEMKKIDGDIVDHTYDESIYLEFKEDVTNP